MRKFLLVALSIFATVVAFPQVTIQMKREGGVSIVPCKVNGLNLKFIFDTGASEISISMAEATFMLKNDYLSKEDIVGKSNYLDANGNISVGVKIILKEVEIGGLKLFNVKASVVNNLKAPLLLGQSAISKLGTVQLDLNANTLTILNFKEDVVGTVVEDDNTTIDTAANVADVADENVGLYEQANEFFDQGNYQEAIEDLDLILNSQPKNKKALLLRAISYDMLEDYKSAIGDYNKLIALDPKNPIALCYRGKSKYDLKDYSGALVDLNKGLLLDDKYTPGFKWRADAKKKMKNLTGAMVEYNKAILLSPADSSLYVDRAFLKQELNDFTGAVTDCNKAISINSGYAYAYYCRGMAKRRLKQHAGATTDFDTAIDLNPELPEAYAARASIKEDIYEDLNGALEDYNKALDLAPDYPYALILKALLEDKIKKNVWISVGSSNKGDKWYIYKETVSKESATIKLWVKGEYKLFTTTKHNRQVSYSNASSLNLFLFNCAEKEFKILSTKNYDSKGTLINEFEYEEYEDWKAITPETVVDVVFTEACKRYNE